MTGTTTDVRDVRHLGDFTTTRRVLVITALAIPGTGRTIGDVAEVTQVDASTGGFAIVNGDPALTVSVFRETGKDEVSTVDGAIEVLDDVYAEPHTGIDRQRARFAAYLDGFAETAPAR